METVLRMLPVLTLLMATNILLGLYAKIGVEEIAFDCKKLISGIAKALIIGFSAVALSYAAHEVDLSGLGVTPELLISAAIITYAYKNFQNLAKCLNIDLSSLTTTKSNIKSK